MNNYKNIYKIHVETTIPWLFKIILLFLTIVLFDIIDNDYIATPICFISLIFIFFTNNKLILNFNNFTYQICWTLFMFRKGKVIPFPELKSIEVAKGSTTSGGTFFLA